MSQQNESLDEGSSVLDQFERWYHVVAIAALMGYMLWVRLRSYDNFIVGGEVFFSGNDPWYHYRETMYTVQNYPFTMPYDPWTGFPYGNLAGQFGTLWDQMVATLVLVVTLGSGDPDTAMRVMLVATPIAATLVAIPTYFIAKRFTGRFGAVFAVLILALIPGQFLTRSLVGSYQHHAAETLFMSIAALAFLVAFRVAERHKPVWELVLDKDLDALRIPLKYSALAGVATALYMYVWQPGVLLVGILGLFLVVKITSDVVHERSPEPTVFVGAVALTLTGLLMVIPLEDFGFRVTGYSFLQIFLPIAVGLGAVFLGFLARQWERNDVDIRAYPPAVGGLIVVSLAIFAVVLPGAFSTIWSNFLNTVGFGATPATRTIAEAQPLLATGEGIAPIIQEFGFTFFTALVVAVGILAAPLVRSEDANDSVYVMGGLALVGLLLLIPQIPGVIGGIIGVGWQLVALAVAALLFVGATYRVEYDVEHLFLLTWGAFLTCAAFTQLRFTYYLVIPVVILNGILVHETFTRMQLLGDPRDVADDIEGWQVMAAASVLILVLGPALLIPMTGGVAGVQAATTYQIGGAAQPGDVVQWDESLQWMNEETPYPGELGNHDHRMDHYGTYDRPADDDFEYPDGAYGVQSWWDYGHWITTRAERIPNANPFQQGATEAANFLLAPDEQQAEDVLARQSDEGENTRYVMVDWQMASPQSKFMAPTVFYSEEDLDQEDFFDVVYQQRGQGYAPMLQTKDQRYYESLMIRLYEYHGSAMDPEPIVVDWDETPVQTQTGEEITINTVPAGEDDDVIKSFENISEAEAYVEEQDGTAQIGGVGPYPSERVEALEHYRLVHATQQPAFQTMIQRQQLEGQLGLPQGMLTRTDPSWVKTFERVPGATIEGSGAEPGQEIEATVEMQKGDDENATFEYTQYATADEDGEFTLHVPYSTEGYDEFGPENGYTDVDVTATGPFELTTEAETDDEMFTTRAVGEVDVSEAQVVGVDDDPATVELEEEILDCPEGSPDCPDEVHENDEEGDDEDEESNGDDETDALAGEPLADAATSAGPA